MNNPSNRRSMLSRGWLAKSLGLVSATTAIVIGVAGVGSAFAQQTIHLSPERNYSASEPTTVNVKGTVPSGTDKVGIAVCDNASGVERGTHCDLLSASDGGELAPASTYASSGLDISVRRGETATEGWPSFNFTTGSPFEEVGQPTLCKDVAGEGAQCAVEVSYYHETETGLEESSEAKNIRFANPTP